MSRAARRRRPLIAVSLAFVVLGGAGAAVVASRTGDARSTDSSLAGPSAPAGTPSTPVTGDAAGSAAATSAPVASGAGTHSSGDALPDTDLPDTGQPATVAVTTTYSGWDPSASAVVTGGFVGDLIEEGGTCSLVLSRDGVVLTGESTATPDASSTSCGEVRVTGAQLTPGPWEGVLRYSSPDTAGESAPFSVVVP
ncbi:hypothetical protein [Geodermatophilus sp. SYSU D00710]